MSPSGTIAPVVPVWRLFTTGRRLARRPMRLGLLASLLLVSISPGRAFGETPPVPSSPATAGAMPVQWQDGWNIEDSTWAAARLAERCLAHPWLKRFLASAKRKPQLALGPVISIARQEFDTAYLLAQLAQGLQVGRRVIMAEERGLVPDFILIATFVTSGQVEGAAVAQGSFLSLALVQTLSAEKVWMDHVWQRKLITRSATVPHLPHTAQIRLLGDSEAPFERHAALSVTDAQALARSGLRRLLATPLLGAERSAPLQFADLPGATISRQDGSFVALLMEELAVQEGARPVRARPSEERQLISVEVSLMAANVIKPRLLGKELAPAILATTDLTVALLQQRTSATKRYMIAIQLRPEYRQSEAESFTVSQDKALSPAVSRELLAMGLDGPAQAADLATELLAHPWLEDFVRRTGRTPVVFIAPCDKGPTSQANSTLFAEYLEKALLGSGQVRVRACRQPVVAAPTAATPADQGTSEPAWPALPCQAADYTGDFIIVGTFSEQRTVEAGRGAMVSSQVRLELTDTLTNDVIWSASRQLRAAAQR